MEILVTGSSATSGRRLTTALWTDITSQGTLELSVRRFTTPNTLVTGTNY